MLKDPALEARAREVSKALRCVQCQNEAIDESNAEIARDMRILVRERLKAGDSNEQIIAYMTSRYGDYVRLMPRFTAKTLLLWFGPLAVLLLGAVAVDGGFIELARRFDDWESCRTALTPPRLIGTPVATIEAHIRRAHPAWPESGILGALANFEVRHDGTIAPWLTLDRHLMILRSLYEHRPSTRFDHLDVPMLLEIGRAHV